MIPCPEAGRMDVVNQVTKENLAPNSLGVNMVTATWYFEASSVASMNAYGT